MTLKILHLCLASFYIDNYSYQENMLPKYHKKMGYEVEIIASLFTFNQDGKGTLLNGPKSYINEYGIPVTRLAYKKKKFSKRIRQYEGTYEAIENSQPDIIFIHGCQFLDIKYIVNYVKKHPETRVYVDNHADFSNSAQNFLSKNVLHKVIWKRCAHLIEPYTSKFYGVLPARVGFIKNIYKIPADKVELLVMGADDESVEEAKNPKTRENIRNKYTIEEDDFLIVTGGKIDNAKKQVLSLMKAVKKLGNKKIKLIVYGSVIDNLKDEVQKLSENNSIDYIGWIDNAESYNLFSAADLLVFPGRHSVYWEQAVAMGKPLIVKYWEGTTHIDIGGNCVFLYENTEEEIYATVKKIVNDSELYNDLLINAISNKRNNFLYSEIAKKSIGDN